MNILDWLLVNTARLTALGITSARLDCLLFLEDELGHDRSWVLAHPEYEIELNTINVLEPLITARMAHKPMAQLRGHCEFYGRTFKITPDVLQPRPETETMIELLLQIFTHDPRLRRTPLTSSESGATLASFDDNYEIKTPLAETIQAPPNGLNDQVSMERCITIADVGTGSGALGITAQLELPDTVVELLELDAAAIAVAQTNVINHTTGMPVIMSDLLSAATIDYDILLCNLPYVPDGCAINEAAKFEPAIALFGGSDGLDLYRRLFDQIKNVENKPLYILFESLESQHIEITKLVRDNGYSLSNSRDLIQVFIRIS
ncbi:peptide chain release factor N(5)-glutamine methyltransferase [Candidatus Saccharibacteria bacterium]|nr:peptide chain release factor N(5)-glutamine methyltransferase [Candidatus Saccharibacteria bacterium]